MRRNLVQITPRPEALHLFQGHSLLISAQDGTVRGKGDQGLYHHNTRLLACWKHLIDGQELQYVSASPVDTYSMLGYYLVPTARQKVPGLKDEESGLAVRVSRFVGDGMHEDVDIENYTQTTVHCELAWEISAD